MARVECYFDLGSPYSYLAYHALPAVAQARRAEVVWLPILLGGVFLATGNRSPVEVGAKAQYSRVDLERWAASYGIESRENPHFPVNTLLLMRIATGLKMTDETAFHRYVDSVFSALFREARNLADPAVLESTLASAGFVPNSLLELAQRQHVKAALRDATDEAVKRGVFGAPTFFVGKDMYWGQDRLHFVDAALASG